MYCNRSMLVDKSGSVVGLQLGKIDGLATQQVSSLEQMKAYVDRLNSVAGVRSRTVLSVYDRDMRRFNQQIRINADYQFRYYMQFALRPNIPVYERVLRVKESVTLIPGDYYMIAFERASCEGSVQRRLDGKMIVRERDICYVPLDRRFYNMPGCESYASYWGIDSNFLIVLIEKTDRGKYMHDAILNALRAYRLGVVSGAYGKPGLQLLFIDSVVRR